MVAMVALEVQEALEVMEVMGDLEEWGSMASALPLVQGAMADQEETVVLEEMEAEEAMVDQEVMEVTLGVEEFV